ncbi:MAG: hypothetical protein ACTSRB_15875, partial [Candidatus Helarchaeota archaeon]
ILLVICSILFVINDWLYYHVFYLPVLIISVIIFLIFYFSFTMILERFWFSRKRKKNLQNKQD